MAITEITFLSGFQPIQSELKQVSILQKVLKYFTALIIMKCFQIEQSNRCNVKRTDFKGRVLSVYFEEVFC